MKTVGLMMTLTLILAQSAMASNLALPAHDNLTVSNQDGKTYLNLNGNEGSTTSEIFSIMEKSGVKVIQMIEGREFQGDLLYSSVLYLNGIRFNAGFTIDPTDSSYGIEQPRCAGDSHCADTGSRLILTGAAAQELFDDMEKAGLPESKLVGATTVVGQHVSCSEAVTYPVSYHCSIDLNGGLNRSN